MADADAIFRPQFDIETVEERLTLVTDTEAGGLGIRRQKWQTPRYRIRFTSAHATAAEAAAVLAFFDGKKGQLTTFTFTNPDDGLVYTCRFARDELSRVRSGVSIWEFDIELVGTR